MQTMPAVSVRFVLLFAACALSAPALAYPQNKAIGSAKEDDECLPCPKPAGLVVAGADVALTRALLWAVEPAPVEVRALAVEDLGLLGDTRALNALAQLSLDPNPRIATAAIRATGLIRHPRAEEILSNVVRHPSLPEALKVQAISLLPFQNSDSSARFLGQVARTTTLSLGVQAAARGALSGVPQARGGTAL